jgi:hypothetical protein
MGGYVWSIRNYIDTTTDKSTSVGHLEQEITIPKNKVIKTQPILVQLKLADTARTANPRLWVYLIDCRDHPATSSDEVMKVPAPISQAHNTTYNYIIGDMPYTAFDSAAAFQLLATDFITVPVPSLILSTAQKIRLYVENDTGVATDELFAWGTYLIADKSGGPG